MEEVNILKINGEIEKFKLYQSLNWKIKNKKETIGR